MTPNDLYVLPLDQWIQAYVNWSAIYLYPFFNAIKWPVGAFLGACQDLLLAMDFRVFIVAFTLLAWRLSNWRVALFSAATFTLIAFLGIWQETMTTLALVTTAIVFCVIVGVPLGILSAQSNRFWAVLRPILDIMQTTPSFVYLVPVVMLFGVGTVSGAVAVVIVAMPPIVRFTNLGIRMVPSEMYEAGLAFGATRRQLLMEVQLPQAMPTIMGGLNQTILMAMVMAVIIALIGAKGLGMTVLQGLGRLDVGLASVGGIGIVLLAIVFDRITQEMGKVKKRDASSSQRFGLLRLVLGDGLTNRLTSNQ